MRFFHLSDLHIGIKLMNRDLSEDLDFVLAQVIRCASKYRPDAVLLAGDIYDKAVPSAEAVSQFDRFLTALTEAVPEAEIMAISGNHDSAPRINAYRALLSGRHVHMIGLPPMKPDEHIEKVTMNDEHGKVHFYLLPFVRPANIRLIAENAENGANSSYNEAVSRLIGREAVDESERNVLVSHQFYIPSGEDAAKIPRAESEIVTVGNIDAVDAAVLKRFDYAALGHIHRPMNAGDDRHRYSGTPLAMSVSEAGQEKGIVMVDLGKKGEIRTEVLPLRPLRRIRLLEGRLEELLKEPSEDYVRVTLTDTEEFDAFDMQERLRLAFPNLLEIRRAVMKRSDYTVSSERPSEMSAYELCASFLGGLTEEEAEVMKEVIDEAEEVRV